MKKIIFLCHDPGGYDVVFPLAKRYSQEVHCMEFYCSGPSASFNPLFSVSSENVLSKIYEVISSNELKGLVTGTSWGTTLEIEAIALCKEHGIPTCSILDYWSNYKNRFKYGNLGYVYPDYYIVMDDLAKHEAINEGVPSQILYSLGHPGLDRVLERRQCEKNSMNTKKILFLSQPLSKLYGTSLGYTEQTVLEDCLTFAGVRQDLDFHIKFHPKDDEGLKRKFSYLTVEGDLLDLLPQYHLVIGMTTMGLLHAILCGVKTISYQPNLINRDLSITSKLGLTKAITDRNELSNMFNDISTNTKVNPIVESELGKFIWLDGKSTDRIYYFLQEVYDKT